MKYDAVIYDLDGTILNTFDMNIYPLMQIIKEELALDMNYDELTYYMSFPGPETLELLEIEDIPTVYARWVQYVNQYEKGASIYFNFDEIIRELDGKVTQAVVSSKKRKQYEIDMADKNLDKYFSAVILLEDTEKHKPNPAALLDCADLLGLDPEKCVYVGDALSDFQAAKNAGMDFIFASWASLKPEEIKDPNAIINHPNELLNLLSK